MGKIQHTLSAQPDHGLEIDSYRRPATRRNEIIGNVGNASAVSHWRLFRPWQKGS